MCFDTFIDRFIDNKLQNTTLKFILITVHILEFILDQKWLICWSENCIKSKKWAFILDLAKISYQYQLTINSKEKVLWRARRNPFSSCKIKSLAACYTPKVTVMTLSVQFTSVVICKDFLDSCFTQHYNGISYNFFLSKHKPFFPLLCFKHFF